MTSAYRRSLLLLCSVACLSVVSRADVLPSSHPGVIRVTMTDDQGHSAPLAHLYLYDQDRKRFLQTPETGGRDSLTLAPGNYRLYAAYTRNNHGTIDHFASAEATVQLQPSDNTSVILSLQPKDVDELENIGLSTRRKLGIDEVDLANGLN